MTKKRYFHIQNLDKGNVIWSKGQNVAMNNSDHNIFYKGLIGTTGRKIVHMDKEIGLMEYAELKEKEISNEPFKYNPSTSDLLDSYVKKSSIYRELTYEMNENLSQYLKWIREEIFENYRLLNHPNFPSRKTCLWICELNDIQTWWEILYIGDSKKIIEIELNPNGKIHCGNGSLIISETLNIEDYFKLAKEYWDGIFTPNCEKETLFEGTFKVINEFEKIEDI